LRLPTLSGDGTAFVNRGRFPPPAGALSLPHLSIPRAVFAVPPGGCGHFSACSGPCPVPSVQTATAGRGPRFRGQLFFPGFMLGAAGKPGAGVGTLGGGAQGSPPRHRLRGRSVKGSIFVFTPLVSPIRPGKISLTPTGLIFREGNHENTRSPSRWRPPPLPLGPRFPPFAPPQGPQPCFLYSRVG